ncbi:helix-turn-helix domain-containing protein [Chloroflexota bacterium]
MPISSEVKITTETEQSENKLPARLLAVNEIARFLGVHSSTVRRWEKNGLLKSYAIGLRNNLRFKQEDVLNFLAKCKNGGD